MKRTLLAVAVLWFFVSAAGAQDKQQAASLEL
jgi:hypothetical protein